MDEDFELESMSVRSGNSSIGEAVSGRGPSTSAEGEGEGEGFEVDDLYYIPERRPSLDLGPTPMDTSNWHYVDQALSPALSYSTMASDEGSSGIGGGEGSTTRIQLSKSDSFSSCYSLDSEDCEKRIPKVKPKKDDETQYPRKPELDLDPNKIRHPSLTVKFTFTAISRTLQKLSEGNFSRIKNMLWRYYPQEFNVPTESLDLVDVVDRLLECYTLEVALAMTKALLKNLGQHKRIDWLESLCIRNEVAYDLRETLKKKYGEVSQDLANQGAKRPFDDIYANLYLSTSCNIGPNIEHEAVKIPKLNTKRNEPKVISTKDFLSAESLENSHTKLLVLTGAAGSGKSMVARRFILDWAEERSHQHVTLLFPLSFRELKQFEEGRFSMFDILQTFYPETQKLRDVDFNDEECIMMFILDGLDEYKGEIRKDTIHIVNSYKDREDLNDILVNVLRGRLFYHSLVLMLSRPRERSFVPCETHYTSASVNGFLDPARDEYFKKRFQDPEQAARVIALLDSVKTFRVMCHLPLFCTLLADECQRLFSEQGTQAALPRSITYMYTKLLLALTRSVRSPNCSPEDEKDFMMRLGKLAFNMLEKGEFQINRYAWKNFGIDVEDAISQTGFCVQYFITLQVLCSEKVISFIHPTMQEYFAALYVFHTFRNTGKNIFEQQLKQKLKGFLKGPKIMEMYKNAMDKSLQCEDGKLDFFLRFLIGMAVKSNAEMLEPFCTPSAKWQSVVENVEALIRKKIHENQYPGRNSNLQLCLEELGVESRKRSASTKSK